jgi:N-acetylglutamate synthase-like GNAT family acetyltransferase/DNA-binding MarR family transcriptional regulator
MNVDYLNDLGNLALGSRLKRLADRLGQQVGELYREQGIDFEPRWFPVFRYVADKGTASVTDIAVAVGVTHPAVNQISEELTRAGYLNSVVDRSDKRKRMLSLSAEGKRIKLQLEPIWKVLHAALSDVSEEIQNDLVNQSMRFEKALRQKSLSSRFSELKSSVLNAQPEVVDYSPEIGYHFARLNRVWIEKYFYLEQEDLRVLGDPQKIIDDGGFVFFAKVGNKVVGTCALIKSGEKCFELVKMAVDEAYRGSGVGRLLLERSIERAKAYDARELILETNTVLESAVRLYRKLGFREIEAAHESKFSRVNLTMSLQLNAVISK